MKIEIDLNNRPADKVLQAFAEMLQKISSSDRAGQCNFAEEETSEHPDNGGPAYADAEESPEAPKPQTVPVSPPPAPAPQAEAGEPLELDINGLPWDARIHSAGRTKNADGSWRNKRGVDEAERERVEAELGGLQNPEPVAPPAPPAPAPSVFDKTPAPPAADSQPLTFASIMRRAAAEKKTAADLEAAYAAVGVKNAPGLAAKPELFESFAAALFGE